MARINTVPDITKNDERIVDMTLKIALICIVGIAVDVCFIRAEYAGKMAKATALKGMASFFFVLLGFLCYRENPSPFGKLVMIGLVLGMLGDILLNLRNQFEGGKSMKIFAVGILAFLCGHFLYIAALLNCSKRILLPAILVTALLSVTAIPPLMKRITAPNKGLKVFGYVYLVTVIAMFSCAAVLLAMTGATAANAVFTIGGLLFVFSDFIMIYYSFGKKIKPLRAINLLSYYTGQLLIAVCILLA